MTTNPARLARVTTSSGSWAVAQARSRSLYRAWYRSAPEIVQLYAANFPASAVRAKIRQDFEKNRYVDDLATVDILLHKGWVEYQETMNLWKMDSHVLQWFVKDDTLPHRPTTFLDSFYVSRDDNEVQPTA